MVRVGMIGAWGEWHSYSDSGDYAIDEAALVRRCRNLSRRGCSPKSACRSTRTSFRRRPAV